MEKLSLFKTTETLIECSPNCPNLRTLILHEYSTLSSIGESFFKQMHGLTFLDLENIRIIKLPDSISDLVNLVALMLNYCGCLEYVPSLAKLASLETLDLRDCRSLTKLPEGMENLFNLRCLNLTYLNLMKTLSKEEFPSEILPKLQVLQSLKVDGRFLKAKEVQSLKKLECLKCMFTEDEYIEIWTPILKEGKQILPWSDYDINVCGKLYKYDGYEGDADYQKVIRKELKFYECKSEDLQIPRDVKYLEIFRCYGLRSLHNIHPIEDATELSGLFIDSCRGLDSLFSLSAVSSNESTFSNKGTFSHLKKFDVIGCDGIRKLFPQRLLINLRELEVINVENCNLLEEVIEDGLRSLHNIHPIEDATELSCLGIYYCDRMKSLFPLSSVSSNEPTFSNKGAFSHLKEVYVDGCSSIRKLFPKRLLKNLQQLEVIVVSRCKRLEEVITMEDEGFTVSSDERSGGVPSMNINATLPNLNSLQLMWLPELKRICSGKLVCDALESLDVTKCPKLKWMPISFSGLDYGLYPSLRSVYIDNEAWENLEWEHPQVQDFLSARRMG